MGDVQLNAKQQARLQELNRKLADPKASKFEIAAAKAELGELLGGKTFSKGSIDVTFSGADNANSVFATNNAVKAEDFEGWHNSKGRITKSSVKEKLEVSEGSRKQKKDLRKAKNAAQEAAKDATKTATSLSSKAVKTSSDADIEAYDSAALLADQAGDAAYKAEKEYKTYKAQHSGLAARQFAHDLREVEDRMEDIQEARNNPDKVRSSLTEREKGVFFSFHRQSVRAVNKAQEDYDTAMALLAQDPDNKSLKDEVEFKRRVLEQTKIVSRKAQNIFATDANGKPNYQNLDVAAAQDFLASVTGADMNLNKDEREAFRKNLPGFDALGRHETRKLFDKFGFDHEKVVPKAILAGLGTTAAGVGMLALKGVPGGAATTTILRTLVTTLTQTNTITNTIVNNTTTTINNITTTTITKGSGGGGTVESGTVTGWVGNGSEYGLVAGKGGNAAAAAAALQKAQGQTEDVVVTTTEQTIDEVTEQTVSQLTEQGIPEETAREMTEAIEKEVAKPGVKDYLKAGAPALAAGIVSGVLYGVTYKSKNVFAAGAEGALNDLKTVDHRSARFGMAAIQDMVITGDPKRDEQIKLAVLEADGGVAHNWNREEIAMATLHLKNLQEYFQKNPIKDDDIKDDVINDDDIKDDVIPPEHTTNITGLAEDFELEKYRHGKKVYSGDGAQAYFAEGNDEANHRPDTITFNDNTSGATNTYKYRRLSDAEAADPKYGCAGRQGPFYVLESVVGGNRKKAEGHIEVYQLEYENDNYNLRQYKGMAGSNLTSSVRTSGAQGSGHVQKSLKKNPEGIPTEYKKFRDVEGYNGDNKGAYYSSDSGYMMLALTHKGHKIVVGPIDQTKYPTVADAMNKLDEMVEEEMQKPENN